MRVPPLLLLGCPFPKNRADRIVNLGPEVDGMAAGCDGWSRHIGLEPLQREESPGSEGRDGG